MVSLVRPFACLMAVTETPNFTAILLSVSPETTVYLRTTGVGVAVAVVVGLGVAVPVGFGEALTVGEALGFGLGETLGLGVGLTEGEAVGFGPGSVTVVPALCPVGIKSANLWSTITAGKVLIGV